MVASRLVWGSIVLATCYLIVLAKEGRSESNQNISDKENVINNEIIYRKSSTNKTVAKVEAILAKNPTLPRLTRGEIIAILENITKSDDEKSKLLSVNITTESIENNSNESVDINNDNKNTTRKEKSLLVVLPYNPSNDSRGGLEVLYTKEPMTRLLLEATTPSLTSQNSRHPHTGNLERITTTSTTTPRPSKRRRKPSMKPIVVLPQQEQRPVYIHNTKTSTTTQPPFDSSSEEQWKPYTAYDSPLVVTQKPSTVDFPLPENMKNTLENLNLPKNHKPDGQSVYVTLPDKNDMFTTTTTKRPRKKSRPKTTSTTTSIVISITPSPPSTTKVPKRRTTTTPPLPDIAAAADSLTPEMKDMLAQLGLVPGQQDGGFRTTNLPLSTTQPPPINPTVDISSYMSFKPLPVKGKYGNNGNNDAMDNDMRQILSNFGLLSTDNQPNSFRIQKSMDVDDDYDKNDTLIEKNDNKNDTVEEQIQKNKQMTLSDINTDVLSDEMKDMLEDLGVIKDSKRRGKGHIFNPVTQSALLEQPEKAERISKVLGDIKKLSEDNKTLSLDAAAIRAHLENITSVVFSDEDNRSDKEAEEDLSFSQSDNEADDDEDHSVIFGANGNFDGYEPDEEELLRIQGVQDNSFANNLSYEPAKLNRTTDKPFEDILSSKKLQEIMSHPDPLSLEELHQMDADPNKNEVKRQQPDNTTEASTESATSDDMSSLSSETTTPSSAPEERASSTTEAEEPETSSTTTTTEASPSIQDLEDSFGGETPLVRPNGLYFLLDWNSFLRVGQDNRTVNLSFSPKVGDPRNFIPVNVP